jgi:hypothetical protein
VTAKEFVSRLAPVDFPRLRLIFQWLAANATSLQTLSGMPLHDATDWKEFLHEVADALAEGAGRPTHADRLPRHDATCPDCGHIHQEEGECGEKVGGGRVCLCERKVPA